MNTISGRCSCGWGGPFTSNIIQHEWIRTCRQCGEVVNCDTMQIIKTAERARVDLLERIASEQPDWKRRSTRAMVSCSACSSRIIWQKMNGSKHDTYWQKGSGKKLCPDCFANMIQVSAYMLRSDTSPVEVVIGGAARLEFGKPVPESKTKQRGKQHATGDR